MRSALALCDCSGVLRGPCKRTQQVTTLLRVCWGFLANNVTSVCMGLKVWPVSNYTQQVPTSANIVVVPCKRTQHVGPNNVACCWPTMLHPFEWTFTEKTVARVHWNNWQQFHSKKSGLEKRNWKLYCAFWSYFERRMTQLSNSRWKAGFEQKV